MTGDVFSSALSAHPGAIFQAHGVGDAIAAKTACGAVGKGHGVPKDCRV
jgi:hypothetical protein